MKMILKNLWHHCIYSRAPQPIKEEYLLTERYTNQWYAIAKISGVKLIEFAKKTI